MIQNRNLLLCLIGCDGMVYPDPEFLGFKANDILTFFLRLETDFFDPIISWKTFETNSLKLIFVLDVWFGCDCVCSNIEHLSNIDEIIPHIHRFGQFYLLLHYFEFNTLCTNSYIFFMYLQ